EAVAIGEHHNLACLPAKGQIAEHRDLRRIPVMNVVRGELVIPFELAGIGIDRQQRASVQIVALPIVAIIIRVRISRAVVHEIQRRVICAGGPDPALNLVYYGTGNPNPDYYGDDRKGDNLYTCS